jgi:hypothetical protein
MTNEAEPDSLETWRKAREAYNAARSRYYWKRAQYDDDEIFWGEYEPEIERFREAEKAFDAVPFPESLVTYF